MKKHSILRLVATVAIATTIAMGVKSTINYFRVNPIGKAGNILAVPGLIENERHDIVTTDRKDKEREQFKHSKSYVEGKVSDLSKYKREYETAEEGEKKGIRTFILDEFSNFDKDLIENDTLRRFLEDLESGF